jgi:hypothetical protein
MESNENQRSSKSLVIKLACENLAKNGFSNPAPNKPQGTFPDVYVTTTDPGNGIDYFIGITGRVETKADGTLNPAYNVVRTEDDRRKARTLASQMNRTLAFVTIALRETDGSYAAYFGELEPIGFPREIPMLPTDRKKYRQLAPYTMDVRVKGLLAS